MQHFGFVIQPRTESPHCPRLIQLQKLAQFHTCKEITHIEIEGKCSDSPYGLLARQLNSCDSKQLTAVQWNDRLSYLMQSDMHKTASQIHWHPSAMANDQLLTVDGVLHYRLQPRAMGPAHSELIFTCQLDTVTAFNATQSRYLLTKQIAARLHCMQRIETKKIALMSIAVMIGDCSLVKCN